MSSLIKLPLLAAIVAWSLWLSLLAALSDSPQRPVLPRPAVDLGPQDVVRVVIDALSRNDDPFPDAGIETTFAFASPSNRVNTGPLAKFSRMVKTYPYRVMIDHVASEISEVVMVGEEAYLLVLLTTRDGGEAAFAFRLSRQVDGNYSSMWMTDAVWPVNR
jgi:hypothetical protein